MNKILMMVCASLISTQALAGSLRYGCIGALPDRSVVNFNRGTLGIISTTPPGLYRADLDESKDIRVFAALDLNSGLEHEMKFKNADGVIIKLIETRSRTLSTHETDEPCTGSKIRTLSDERFLKTYKFLIPGESPVRATLKCYNINISTCG